MAQVITPLRIKKILVPIDGSRYSEKAGLTAVEIALKYSATTVLYHVAKYPGNELGISSTHTVSVGIPLSDPLADNLKKQAVACMSRIEAIANKNGIS
jgi:Universal stress protein family